MRGTRLYLWIFVPAICQLSCSGPRSGASPDAYCVPNTFHACRCEDDTSGVQLCSARGTTSDAPCECGTKPAGAGTPQGLSSGGQTASPRGSQANAQSQGQGRAGQPAADSQSNASSAEPSQAPSTPASGEEGPAAGSGAMDTSPSPSVPEGGLGPPVVEPVDEASYLFEPEQVRTYNILVDPADLSSIDKRPADERLVAANLEFEGQRFGPYMVRYKGSQGSFTYPCTAGGANEPKHGKCSIKLDFNEVNDEARFFGLKKLNLHSMNADHSMLRDRLGYQLFREMGVAAPRAAHARVLINGQLEGLFIAVEQIDGRFTRARFPDGGEGNVYKEVWPMHADAAPYQNALETNRDEQPSVEAMLGFKQATDTSAQAVQGYFDRDYLMRYLAVDRLIINDDGALHFWCDDVSGQGANAGEFGNHNYYWYQESYAAKFWLIPWDLDHSFDGNPAVHLDEPWTQVAPCVCRNQSVAGSDRPASCDPLVSHFIEWLPDYEQKVDELLAGPFQEAHVDALLDSWTTLIRSAVVEAAGVHDAPNETAWEEAVSSLRQKIASAREHRGFAY